MKTMKAQAEEYLRRTPSAEVQRGAPFDIGRRQCRCGECFCCWVYRLASKPLRSVVEARRNVR